MSKGRSHTGRSPTECACDNIVEYYAFVNLMEDQIEIKEVPRKSGEVRKSKTPIWKVRKSKTPAKKVMEEWEVFDFRKKEQIFSKCYQNDCSFTGTDNVHKIQVGPQVCLDIREVVAGAECSMSFLTEKASAPPTTQAKYQGSNSTKA